MKKIKFYYLLALLLTSQSQTVAQAIYEDERYVAETDPLVLEKLDEWQGKKFGLLMHWGTYSQWGIVESWSLCPEDYGWCQRTKGEINMPSEVIIKSIDPVKGAKIKLLGSKNNLKWERVDTGFKIIIPEKLRNDPPCNYAWTFKISKINK